MAGKDSRPKNKKKVSMTMKASDKKKNLRKISQIPRVDIQPPRFTKPKARQKKTIKAEVQPIEQAVKKPTASAAEKIIKKPVEMPVAEVPTIIEESKPIITMPARSKKDKAQAGLRRVKVQKQEQSSIPEKVSAAAPAPEISPAPTIEELMEQTPAETVDDLDKPSEDQSFKLPGFSEPKEEKIDAENIHAQEEDVQAYEEKDVLPIAQPAVQENKVEMSEIDHKNQVEALLFAYGKYVDEEQISELCNIDKRSLKKILGELKKDYESRDTALMIFQQDNSWKINVREKYLSIVRKIVADTELPKSVMETLAVIAWKSPIYQSEVVRIRGNKCYDHIEELENTGFISKDKKGRSYVLKTTDKFYNYFEIEHGNLKSVMDSVKIPEINAEELSKQTTLDEAPLIAEDEKDKIHAIDVRKKVETEEEKQSHEQFLIDMENRLKDAAERHKQLIEDIPGPAWHEPGNIQPPIDNMSRDSEPDVTHVTITQTTDIPIQDDPKDTGEDTASHESVQLGVEGATPLNPEAEIAKPKHKSLTKKQLEKKFKDDLVRVRDKMEKK